MGYRDYGQMYGMYQQFAAMSWMTITVPDQLHYSLDMYHQADNIQLLHTYMQCCSA